MSIFKTDTAGWPSSGLPFLAEFIGIPVRGRGSRKPSSIRVRIVASFAWIAIVVASVAAASMDFEVSQIVISSTTVDVMNDIVWSDKYSGFVDDESMFQNVSACVCERMIGAKHFDIALGNSSTSSPAAVLRTALFDKAKLMTRYEADGKSGVLMVFTARRSSYRSRIAAPALTQARRIRDNVRGNSGSTHVSNFTAYGAVKA